MLKATTSRRLGFYNIANEFFAFKTIKIIIWRSYGLEGTNKSVVEIIYTLDQLRIYLYYFIPKTLQNFFFIQLDFFV